MILRSNQTDQNRPDFFGRICSPLYQQNLLSLWIWSTDHKLSIQMAYILINLPKTFPKYAMILSIPGIELLFLKNSLQRSKRRRVIASFHIIHENSNLFDAILSDSICHATALFYLISSSGGLISLFFNNQRRLDRYYFWCIIDWNSNGIIPIRQYDQSLTVMSD